MKRLKEKLMFVMLILCTVSLFALSVPPYSFNWGTIDTRMGSAISVMDIAAFGPDTLIVCGSDGSVLKSIDAGLTWKSVGVIRYEPRIDFVDRNIGYIFTPKEIHKTIDGGESWELTYKFDDTYPSISNLSLIDADTLYATLLCGRNCVSKLMKSTDGGKSWAEKFATKETGNYYGTWINDVKFIDSVGYLITSEGPYYRNDYNDNYEYTIYKSTDYANTWDSVGMFTGYYYFHPCDYFKVIDFPTRQVFMYPKDQDTITIYTEDRTFITYNGFDTLEQIEVKFFERNSSYWDYASMEIQSNGRACFTYQDGYQIPFFGYQKSYIYFTEDYGNKWILVDKQSDPPTWDPETSTSTLDKAYCAARANDTVFYAGWNYGNIRRSPALPFVGIEEIEPLNINVFPNPVGNKLQIDCGGLNLKEVEVYDLVGKRVKSISCGNVSEFTLNTSDLKQGMYVFKIYTENGIITKKINKK